MDSGSVVSDAFPRPVFDRNNDQELFYDFKNFSSSSTPQISPELVEQARLAKLNKDIQSIQEYKAQSSNILHKSLQEIFAEMADAFLGIMEDLFSAPAGFPNTGILDHLFIAFTRKNRLVYVGLMLLVFVLYAFAFQSFS